ncbi:MAG: hypothetical protein PHH59_08015 [Methylovulum sp.]|uniref:hypothetical protein n=1 Tax=Methylovulum sp. TaxID=1916980 RepID=UPI00260954C5|nr:hypothetical protein [Methylovulum sp.]MDD2723950.1 hypothetical protein [Methylovulum sp.]MDD5125749.1 hypothetical protein [Methylovulum sp.]
MVTQRTFLGRTFQLWEYHVSHGSLLIRSPKSLNETTNIDIICSGIEYLSVPRFIFNLEVTEPTLEEFQNLQTIIRSPVPISYIHVLVSNGNRFLVVAASFKIVENTSDIFESPFDNM